MIQSEETRHKRQFNRFHTSVTQKYLSFIARSGGGGGESGLRAAVIYFIHFNVLLFCAQDAKNSSLAV